ncbi:MAG TPA: PEGA domain-containing protein [Phycisphaerae bacterium]|nr:PEGA domain-containing protein [Phycisphaerae bacterium]
MMAPQTMEHAMMPRHDKCTFDPRRGAEAARRPAVVCIGVCLALLLSWAAIPGCIERTVSINTEPEGATVFLNDQEVGQSPVRVPFTWYGDYDLILRKPGYKTIRTNANVKTPWYETPGIDIFTECFVPFTVHDDHDLGTYALEVQQAPDREALLQAADQARAEAAAGG